MMADINFDLEIDVKGAQQSLKRLESVGTATFAALGTAAAAVSAAFAGQQIFSGIKSVTEAAGVQEDAIKRLNTALSLAGDFSEDASKRLQDFASELQVSTGIGDETTIGLLALAKSFNLTNEEAEKLVSAAADLSAQTGMELEGAVRNLGKSFSGLAGELGESVAGIRDLTKEQLKAGGAIDLVASRFGGAAAAAAQTYSGSIRSLSGNFGDLQEELGFLITKNPIVIKLINETSKAFRELGKFISKNSDDIKDGLNDGLIGIVKSAPKVIRGIGSIAKIVIELAKQFNNLDSLLSGFFADLIESTEDVGEAFKILTSPIKGFVLGLIEVEKFVQRQALDDLEEQAQTTREALAKIEDLFTKGKISTEGYRTAVKNAEERLATFEKQIEGVNSEIAILNEAGKQVAIEIDIDAKKLQEDLQVRVTQAEIKAVKLEGAEKIIDDAVQKFSEAAFNAADALEGAGNNLRTIPVPQPGDINFVGPLPEFRDTSSQEGAKDFIGPQIDPADLAKRRDAEKKAQEAESKRLEGILVRAGGQFVNSILKGADGARQAVAGLGGSIAEVLIPGAGGFVTAFIDQIVQLGPEGITQVINEFVTALPVVIEALAEAMPVVAIAIAQNADEIIIALVRAAPRIIEELVKAAPQIASELILSLKDLIIGLGPELASVFKFLIGAPLQSFIDDLSGIDVAQEIENAGQAFADAVSPVTNALSTIASAFTDLLDRINRSLGGGSKGFATGGSDLERAIKGSIPGLATGGLVGGSGSGDTQLFRLEPGELVIDRSTSGRLLDFVNRSERGATQGDPNNEMVVMVLAQILSALQQPMNVETTAEIDGEALANILLRLNRTDARTSA
jgi:hypothetical protein